MLSQHFNFAASLEPAYQRNPFFEFARAAIGACSTCGAPVITDQ